MRNSPHGFLGGTGAKAVAAGDAAEAAGAAEVEDDGVVVFGLFLVCFSKRCLKYWVLAPSQLHLLEVTVLHLC